MQVDPERSKVEARNPGPSVVRRRLGSALRHLREEANIRLEVAARELECSPAKISRLENGNGPAKLWDVRILLTLYGVDGESTRKQFEDWARRTKSVSWWESDADLTTDDLDRYFAAETEAFAVQIFCTPVIPAILQTVDYARAHVRGLFPKWPESDVERFVAVRHARQEPLLRPDNPLKFEAVIDEAALLRRVGTAPVHRAQLKWLSSLLADFAEHGRKNLTFRVLPLTAGPGQWLSPFTIFEPRNRDLDPPSAYIEETTGGSWLEADDVIPLREIFMDLLGMSLPQEESLRRLRAILESL